MCCEQSRCFFHSQCIPARLIASVLFFKTYPERCLWKLLYSVKGWASSCAVCQHVRCLTDSAWQSAKHRIFIKSRSDGKSPLISVCWAAQHRTLSGSNRGGWAPAAWPQVMATPCQSCCWVSATKALGRSGETAEPVDVLRDNNYCIL